MKKLLGCLLLVPGLAFARTYVLETGTYEKITLDDGERWLAVAAPTKGASAVRECVVHVATVDNPEGEPRKVRKVTSKPGDALFLLKGNPKVKAGSAPAVWGPGQEATDKIELTLGRLKWTLERVEEEQPDGPVQRLYASADGQRTLLGQTGTRDSIVPVWAGDLDGDGRLDVYLRIEHHNYHIEEVLCLSSAGGGMPALAARFATRKLD